MTMIQFIVAAASNFSAIIVGPIATNLGWRYLFHLLIPFAALEVVLLFFFVPETAMRSMSYLKIISKTSLPPRNATTLWQKMVTRKL